MSIKSPLEDFLKTTMAAMPGYWHKLVYLAGLRSNSQKYGHWGMARRYGLTASHSAISAAHSELFLQVLGTPIKSLVDDAASASQGPDQKELLEELWEGARQLLPTDLGGGSAKHFEVTLLTVQKVMEKKNAAKGQPESPPQSPGQ
jgi:hypothetical protein